MVMGCPFIWGAVWPDAVRLTCITIHVLGASRNCHSRLIQRSQHLIASADLSLSTQGGGGDYCHRALWIAVLVPGLLPPFVTHDSPGLASQKLQGRSRSISRSMTRFFLSLIKPTAAAIDEAISKPKIP